MKQLSWLAFAIDRSTKVPVFEQICAEIRARIIAGTLGQGVALPPTRVFATELGVSRSTIVTAYEQLVAEGYLEAKPGSGFRVCAMGEVELAEPKPAVSAPVTETGPRAPRAFEPSQPDMRLFPHTQWAKTVSRVCRTNPQAMLTGGGSFGNLDLRRAIARHVSDWRGIEASPSQIIITAGATDGLENCMRTLLAQGDRIGIEDPGYQPIRVFAQAMGLRPRMLALDDAGAEVPKGPDMPQVVVLTPSHQYPLGGAMTPNRRLDYIHWAQQTNGWIIEDDYDSEFRYAGRPIPAMAGFDQISRTIYIGSFSKIFSNTLRLGYLIVPEPLLPDFRATLRRFGVRASYMPQQALAEFIDSGEFYRHLRRVRRVYGERRKYLVDRLTAEFSQWGQVADHQAGMQIVFHLHGGISDRDIAVRAAALGLTSEALSAFCMEPDKYSGLVLGFCGFTIDELGTALDTLKQVFLRSG